MPTTQHSGRLKGFHFEPNLTQEDPLLLFKKKRKTIAGDLERSTSLSRLLSGLAQDAFHGHPGITEELLWS